MKTALHLKLEEQCIKQRTGEQHWFIKGSKTVRIPAMRSAVVTTKRALYAAFVGDVPASWEPETVCGTRGCVRPDHQELRFVEGSKARRISLPEEVFKLKVRGSRDRGEPSLLPRGINKQVMANVRAMAAGGSSIAAIRDATGLSSMDIIRIREGRFDRAMEVASGDVGSAEQAPATSSGIPDLSNSTEEERAWVGGIN